ncbi:hypothetical protein B0O80DRAFT_441452 [Mortierella sp. GBAus27b]|nr:hypothetical protein B0O80DRAFT_441452 [Mortierella sp. GBAus27b]
MTTTHYPTKNTGGAPHGSENVKVYVRVRPPNERELASEGYSSSSWSQGSQSPPTVSVVAPNHVIIGTGTKSDTFTYDCVGGEQTTQEQVFNDVGKTIVEQCIKGYNGTIFAYGQTGSGKTYTMQGPSDMAIISDHKERGIIPRCFEYLFKLIEQQEQLDSTVKYLCRASYIEIYNETIYDLLDRSAPALAIREDIKRGVYVDGAAEESIHSPKDAYRAIARGAANRHTSATSMNKESSRSHSVLTLTIQSMKMVDGINHIRESRFNLVDLAGSERQKQASTEGARLKEAGNINRSLLSLGTVINALGEIANGHSRHVHYRDSRLTFLLRDSLGGNSNTFIVANVSPSALCYQESLSTLRFAQRAKMIKNKAVVNEDIQGNVSELRSEILRLKSVLELKKSAGVGDDAGLTNMLLLETLAQLKTEQEEHLATAQKGFMLDEACKAREKQIQSAQLVIKFKESALGSYRKGANASALEAEKGALTEEITQLRKQLDFHPEVLRVKAENMSLREMLQKYEKYQAGLEEQEEQQKKNQEYFHHLVDKIQEVGRENDTLRATLANTRTPVHSNRNSLHRGMDFEEIDFPRTEGIEDLMQESPPKIRDEDRRFSSDMKSLLQRVTKSRQAEYRRLSGNLGLGNCGLGNTDLPLIQTGHQEHGRSSLSGEWIPNESQSAGVNLSESISAQSNMRSEDSVEVTLLKRDLDRLQDEKSVLIDEKANLEKEFSDSQFQLFTMEKYLAQATHHAEQLGRDLQSTREAYSTMEKEAAMKIMALNKEMQEQVDLMEKMRQASIQVEDEITRVRSSHHGVEQKLKDTTKDLEDQRQRLMENQKEYDHQVEYSMKRLHDFQEKESKWDATRGDLLKSKEELERQLEQEKSMATSTRSELEKDHLKLSEDYERLSQEKSRLEKENLKVSEDYERLSQEKSRLEKENLKVSEDYERLMLEKSKLEDSRAGLEVELTLQSAGAAAAKDHEVKMKQQLEEYEAALKVKDDEANQSLEQRGQLEERIRNLEASHSKDLAGREAQTRSEVEALQAARHALVEAHEQEVQKYQAEAAEQTLQLEEARQSLQESTEKAERALEELATMTSQHHVLDQEAEQLRKEKIRLESQIESTKSICDKLESTLEEQKQELSKTKLRLQQEQWEKERLETTKTELQDKVSEMARKIGETEHKLEQARDSSRMMEMEYKTVQDELEYQLSKVRNDLVLKTNENNLNEEYKRKFRELRAQFADLGPAITERQQQGFHERELKRVMELEKMREEMTQVQTRSAQLEANLALAQEMNEQLLEDSKASTAKIADEMEKRLKEVEIQRRSAEREVEQALETVAQKTAELQALEENVMVQKEKIRVLEEELNEERGKMAQLEGAEGAVQETKQRVKEEQLLEQQQMLVKIKEGQQAFVKQQLERRDRTRALFEGLATENGKLMEQVRDLGLVNESIMKHQNSKQKLQYHVKIKQENNDLRYENQRLMFKTIELEERLGNKANAESLRKQVREMHGNIPHPSALDLELLTGIDADSISMEMVKGLHDEMPIQRSPSYSPALSSDTPSAPASVRAASTTPGAQADRLRSQTPAVISSQKRRAEPMESSTHKRQTTPTNRQASATRPRSMSSPSVNFNFTSATVASSTKTEAVALGPRARAKAAADAALAAKLAGRRQPTPGPLTNRTAPAKAPTPISRPVRSSTPLTQTQISSHDDPAQASTPVPVIGSASAQRALAREARLAAAKDAATKDAAAPSAGTSQSM